MWVDVIVEDILRTRTDDAHIVNDAKSPSGPIHVGSLRGVILHDCVTRGLQEKAQRVRFLYGFDDYDPLDALPAGASEECVGTWASRCQRFPRRGVPQRASGDRSATRLLWYSPASGLTPTSTGRVRCTNPDVSTMPSGWRWIART